MHNDLSPLSETWKQKGHKKAPLQLILMYLYSSFLFSLERQFLMDEKHKAETEKGKDINK